MNDFIAGSFGGCSGQLVGHPLDCIKVRLQNESLIIRKGSGSTTTSAYQCAQLMYKEGGIRAFFRGLSLPLACKGLEQCIAFGIKSSVDDILNDNSAYSITDDSSIRSGMSGGVAGACTALVLTPVYLVKVQLQVTPKHGVGSLNGPIAAIRHTVKRLGLIGLYTGALPIFIGTSIGYSARFATYDKTTNYMKEKLGFDRITSTIIGGSLAGIITWLSHYPLDLIANRMEASIALQTPKMSMTSHIKEIYTHQGISGFFRGLGPCLLRAIPTNATIFLTYDLCKLY